MPPVAIPGGQTICTFGTAPAPLGPTPGTVLIEGKPALTIMDNVPMVNIMPMLMCTSLANPMGMGKPPPAQAPIACIPIPLAPWAPPVAPTKLVNKKPILLPGSTCVCQWGGVISITMPGAMKTMAQ